MALFDPDFLREQFLSSTEAYAADRSPSAAWSERLASTRLDDVETAIAEVMAHDLVRALDPEAVRVDQGGELPDFRCTVAKTAFAVEPVVLLSTPVTEWTRLHPISEGPVERHFSNWSKHLHEFLRAAPRTADDMPVLTFFVTLHEDATRVLCAKGHVHSSFDPSLRHELDFHPARSASLVAGFGLYPNPPRAFGARHTKANHAFGRELLPGITVVI